MSTVVDLSWVADPRTEVALLRGPRGRGPDPFPRPGDPFAQAPPDDGGPDAPVRFQRDFLAHDETPRKRRPRPYLGMCAVAAVMVGADVFARHKRCATVFAEHVPEAILDDDKRWDSDAAFRTRSCDDKLTCGIDRAYSAREHAGRILARSEGADRATRTTMGKDGRQPTFHAGFPDMTCPAALSEHLTALALAAVVEEEEVAAAHGCVTPDGRVQVPLPKALCAREIRPALFALRDALGRLVEAAQEALAATLGGAVPVEWNIHPCGESDPMKGHWHLHGVALPVLVDGTFRRASKGQPARLEGGALRPYASFIDVAKLRAEWRRALAHHGFAAYLPEHGDLDVFWRWVGDDTRPKAHMKCDHPRTPRARRECAIATRRARMRHRFEYEGRDLVGDLDRALYRDAGGVWWRRVTVLAFERDADGKPVKPYSRIPTAPPRPDARYIGANDNHHGQPVDTWVLPMSDDERRYAGRWARVLGYGGALFDRWRPAGPLARPNMRAFARFIGMEEQTTPAGRHKDWTAPADPSEPQPEPSPKLVPTGRVYVGKAVRERKLADGQTIVEVLLVRQAEPGVVETRWVARDRFDAWPMNLPRPPPAWGEEAQSRAARV